MHAHRKMGTGKTLEEEAWELLGKRWAALRPRERSIRDAWQKRASTMSREEWERHIAWVKTKVAAPKAGAVRPRAKPASPPLPKRADQEGKARAAHMKLREKNEAQIRGYWSKVEEQRERDVQG